MLTRGGFKLVFIVEKMATIKATYMLKPPRRGVGCAWTLLLFGLSTYPVFKAIFLIIGVIEYEIMVEIANISNILLQRTGLMRSP